MKRIDTSTRARDLFGLGKDGFKDGDLANGLLPTDLNAVWFNMIQEELANLIEARGIALSADGSDRAQLLNVLKGRLIGVRGFSSTTVYVPTVGTQFIRVRLIGGGGAGGGATTTGAGAVSGGSGGSSGAYVEKLLTAGFSGQTIQIGAAGSPIMGLTGGSGGSTTFAGLTAQGGLGGAMFGASAPPILASYGNTAVGIGGDLNIPGQSGGPLLFLSLGLGLSGVGADGVWGSGGDLSNGGSASGGNGTGWGSGGGGALVQANSGPKQGGAGRQGFCIIEEFA